MTCEQIAKAAKLELTIESLKELPGFKSLAPAVETAIAMAKSFGHDITIAQAMDKLAENGKPEILAQFSKAAMGKVKAGTVILLDNRINEQHHVLKYVKEQLSSVESNRVTCSFTIGNDGKVRATFGTPYFKALAKEKQDSHNSVASAPGTAATIVEVRGGNN